MAYSKETQKKRKKMMSELDRRLKKLEKGRRRNIESFESFEKENAYQAQLKRLQELGGKKNKRKLFSYNKNISTTRLEKLLKLTRKWDKSKLYTKKGYKKYKKHMQSASLYGHHLRGYDFTEEQFKQFYKIMNNEIFKELQEQNAFSSDEVRDMIIKDKNSDFLSAFKIADDIFNVNDSTSKADADAVAQIVVAVERAMSDGMSYNRAHDLLQNAFTKDIDYTIDNDKINVHEHLSGRPRLSAAGTNVMEFAEAMEMLDDLPTMDEHERTFYEATIYEMF